MGMARRVGSYAVASAGAAAPMAVELGNGGGGAGTERGTTSGLMLRHPRDGQTEGPTTCLNH